MTQKTRHVLLLISSLPLGVVVFAMTAVPVLAQSAVGQLVDLIKNKAGFGYADNPAYVFSKDTPNYTAYAGDAASAGGHRIGLFQDGAEVEYAFTASALVATTSAAVEGAATPSATITPDQQRILTLAEEILSRQATNSAGTATTSATYINEDGISTDERTTLSSASAILQLVFPVTDTITQSSTASGASALTTEQSDFILYIRLQEYRVSVLSRDVSAKMDVIKQDVGAIVSKAKLVDDDKERKVVFGNIVNTIDMVYRLNEYGIEQQIVLNDRANIQNSFSFSLSTHGLTYRNVGDHGVWYFSDSLGYVMRFTKGYAKDADGKFTNDVTTDITRSNGQDTVKFTVPSDWLSDPARAFPVTITASLEIVPELRAGALGAGDRRLLRQQLNKVSATPLPTLTVSAPAGVITPTQTPTPAVVVTPPDTGTPSATPEITPDITPQLTPTATPEPASTGSASLQYKFNIVYMFLQVFTNV